MLSDPNLRPGIAAGAFKGQKEPGPARRVTEEEMGHRGLYRGSAAALWGVGQAG